MRGDENFNHMNLGHSPGIMVSALSVILGDPWRFATRSDIGQINGGHWTSLFETGRMTRAY